MKRSFLREGMVRFKDIGKLYGNVLRRPGLIIRGCAEVVGDLIAIPLKLVHLLAAKKSERELPAQLKESASLSLAISEVAAVPGTFAGIALVNALTENPYLAGSVGAIAGSYVAAVLSYVLSYMALSRKGQGYSLEQSVKDGFRVIRDCVPASAAIYAINSPSILGLMKLGFTENIAALIVTIWGTILFSGIAKISANQTADAVPVAPAVASDDGAAAPQKAR